MILDVGTAGVNTVIELAADGAQLDAARTIIAEAKVQAEAGGKRPSQEAKRRSRRLIHPTPTRQSERQKAMANGDAPVANRAEFLKKIHNLEVVAGNKFNPTSSILSLPNKTLLANISKLGVSLGRNDIEVDESIYGTKISEVDRFVALHASSFVYNGSSSNVDNDKDELLKLSSIQHLCSDWQEESEGSADESFDSCNAPQRKKILTKAKNKVVCPPLAKPKMKRNKHKK